ncbi:uncharacterized protein MONOS_5382 [Monocercomonoides exilis]|uniref:uncharacterized protein n=1 Tax=Monocercomonoides exilis TaxID=2049356 RepID=UPI0035595CED|nr:hypothetical protein MONOS_5382 [Monocercomonoides exilis]|eukprot:MONOS_5382.1-p1 / transcript=MONOS_5382.1 / gene=MONOS_5382 / organism=Monocercomonoides_exilis_PA203 / gene_product=unspecified product / transcript_product=unspecified product / location=Mono_scaffold00155:105101-105387(+) / protein_length=77 / sequence_SO=supercontig / SO=protein_coding / is_pseudo=false
MQNTLPSDDDVNETTELDVSSDSDEVSLMSDSDDEVDIEEHQKEDSSDLDDLFELDGDPYDIDPLVEKTKKSLPSL